MFIVAILIFGIVLSFLYKRYYPVSGVERTECSQINREKINIIDLRDYNVSNHNPVLGSRNIPVAYLNRNLNEIPKDNLHVIASGRLEKNVGIRFLRHKGYKVVGYTIADENHLKSYLEGGECNGLQ